MVGTRWERTGGNKEIDEEEEEEDEVGHDTGDALTEEIGKATEKASVWGKGGEAACAGVRHAGGESRVG
ncbi:hypothetical protein FACS189472_14450 [Alphaproteobacteria bacterium]|nr:hypothetical protein FACS189472_14450 [Alphaproteobacteria bacterium]